MEKLIHREALPKQDDAALPVSDRGVLVECGGVAVHRVLLSLVDPKQRAQV